MTQIDPPTCCPYDEGCLEDVTRRKEHTVTIRRPSGGGGGSWGGEPAPSSGCW